MGMSIEDCTKMLIAKEKCMSRETSGIDTECNLHNCDNCDLCYEQGTMGEQKEALKFAVDTMRKYQQLQADYENRLKADMAAMLEDLRLDFQEAELAAVFDNKELIFADEIDDLVQQKINSLKENT